MFRATGIPLLMLGLGLGPVFAHADDDTVQRLQIMGVTVNATSVGHMVNDPERITDLTVVEPVTFTFARGNSFTANAEVFLHENGNVSMIVSNSAQSLEWKTVDDRIIHLNCNQRSTPEGVVNRLVRFDSKGEYIGGCASIAPLALTTPAGDQVTVSGDLDVDSEFRLLSAALVEQGQVHVGHNLVTLHPGTSLAIYPDGKPNYLTLEKGEKFITQLGIYGVKHFVQNPARYVTTLFFPDGRVQHGVIGDELVDRRLLVPVPEGSGVVFTDGDYRLMQAVFTSPVKVQTADITVVASQWAWDQDSGLSSLIVAEPFDFVRPDNQQAMPVPVGAVVVFNPDGGLFQIQMPRAPRLAEAPGGVSI